jgi:hypothetical protein
MSTDLSGLAKDSMWVTSQAGGNMVSSNDGAHTAPGSQPVDKLTDRDVQSDPHVELPPPTPPGTDGKPKAHTWTKPGPPAWTPVSHPDPVREA